MLAFLRLPILRFELRCSASVSSVQNQITKNTKRNERCILFALLRDDMADILTYSKSTRFTAYQSRSMRTLLFDKWNLDIYIYIYIYANPHVHSFKKAVQQALSCSYLFTKSTIDSPRVTTWTGAYMFNFLYFLIPTPSARSALRGRNVRAGENIFYAHFKMTDTYLESLRTIGARVIL